MTWAAPDRLLLLWALPLLALLAWLALRARARALEQLGALVGELSSEGAGRLHARRMILLLLASALGVVALAGPRWGYRWEELKREGLSLVVVLDVSSSMAAEDVSPSRMERARRKVIDLADLLEGDRVGLVVFAGGAYPRMPLTLDYDALRQMARESDTETLAAQGSDLGAAIDAALALLGGVDSAADRAVLIISDGEDQVGEAKAAARRAAESGVHIYALGVGTEEGAPIPLAEGGFKKDKGGEVVLTKLDEDTLKEVAQAGAGAYVRASAGAGDLRRLYEEEIRGKLKSAEQGARREKIWNERYQWPLGLAVLLAGVAVALRPGPLKLRAGGAAVLLALSLGAAPRAEAAESAEIDRLMTQHVERPDDLGLAERLGGELFRAGEYAKAEEVLEGVAARAKDPEQAARARYNAGLAAYKGGRLTEALDDWKQVLARDPEHASAKQNAEAVQKEIAARLQQQQQQQQDQQQQDQQQQDQQQQDQQQQDQQQQDQQQQDQQQQDQQQQDQQQQDQQQQDQARRQDQQQPQAQPPEGDGTREERQDTGQQSEAAEAQPTDSGAPEEGEPEAGDRPGAISAQEADRLLDGVEEGEPRVVVKPKSRGGKDW